MSPPAPIIQLRHGSELAPEREKWDWSAVVARYTRDDWPPPGWLARTMELAPYPVPEEQTSVAA